MRLFLSSQDLGNYPEVALRMADKNTKLAFIKNAQDDKSPENRNSNTLKKKIMFEQAGFEFEEIDLRDYFGKANKLENKLQDFGVIWCNGGNTFILRRAMMASGLDNLLINWLKKDRVMYGGSSAGSCVTAVSLKGAKNKDGWPNSDTVPDGYPIKKTIWNGLGLVPFIIVPHADQDWYKEEFESVIKYLRKHELSYEALNDGQVVIVDGDKIEILT